MIKDTHDREHNYLRISLTDVCNLRCFYCMPLEHYDFTPHKHLMQPDEIESIAKEFVRLGVNKIRLTGGEPLARKDFEDIVKRLAILPVHLTLTTNAILLDRYINVLQQAGVTTLNISLDTLSAETFKRITQRDRFDVVMANIRMAIDRGFKVKINMVVMKGVNDHEIIPFIAWTRTEAIDVRFIEFMPFEGNKWTANQVFSLNDILAVIAAEHEIIPLAGLPNDTVKRYGIDGHRGTFGVISTMSSPFCGGCNRMRLTADGKMKNCLFSGTETNLLAALRAGDPVDSLIRTNILMKAKKLGGQFDEDYENLNQDKLQNRSMISIGG